MRSRSYYTPNEILINQYTFGQEWQLPDGSEYIGLYHRYVPTNEIYSEKQWDSRKSKKLTEYQELPAMNKSYKQLQPDLKTTYESFTAAITVPLADDYTAGFVSRYFIKRINSTSVYEISAETYSNFQQKLIDPNIHVAVEIKWYITGPVNDVVNDSITTYGVTTKNMEEISKAVKTIPELSKHLTDLIQFYTSLDIYVPKDINLK